MRLLSMFSAFFIALAAVGVGAAIAPEWRKSQFPFVADGQIATVPHYVIDYAPVIYLHSEERFLPADLVTYLNHSHPTFKNNTSVPDAPIALSLNNLSLLNDFGLENVHLAANEDFTKAPSWIRGTLPNAQGKTEGATTSTVIVNVKENGRVDAFYIYFYGYNQGNKLGGLSFLQMGNHVCDFEHIMVRFEQGVPQSVYYSQHGAGTAYTYSAVEKHGKRIVGYAGNGTHATWATPGSHSHVIPYQPSTWGTIVDYTDKGHFWDPLQSALFYSVSYPLPQPEDAAPTFSALPDPLASSALTSHLPAPTDWLYYRGRWGDARLATSDPRQVKYFFGIAYKYNAGPQGPMFKDLNRDSVCKRQSSRWWPCVVRKKLERGS